MNKIFIFVLGAAAGSLVTWKIVKEKYRRIADEEIESVIEQYRNRDNLKTEISSNGITMYKNGEEVCSLGNTKIEPAECNVEKTELTEEEYEEYDKIIEDEGYTVETEPLRDYIAPYVISPEEFDEYGNELKSWTLYSDGVITNEVGDIVDYPEQIIGDALEHFGEYEDDCVHVRNEEREWDIEIIKHDKSFSEINKGDN